MSGFPIAQLRRIARLKSGDFIAAEDIEEEGPFPVYGGNGLRGFTARWNTNGPIALVGRQGAQCGNVHVAAGKICVSEHAFRCFPEKPVDVSFLRHSLQSLNLGQYSVSAAQPGLSADNLKAVTLPFPPLDTQRRIAAFLDEKTAQIDALIEKKQALLERLAEKRQAIITQAVTKGLNPDAPMRPSGIDWLGDIPAHWEVKRLRFSVDRIEQGWSPQCDSRPADSGEWGVLKVGCVNGDRFDEAENKALPSDLTPIPRYEIRIGDILISRANTKELLGSAAVVHGTQGRIMFSDKLYRVSIGEDLMSEYIVAFLRSPLARFQYERESTGTSGSMQNIGQDTIANLIHPRPPASEQRAIAKSIGSFSSGIDLAVSKVRAALNILNEYRAALITAAVTGQIEGLR